MANVSYVLASHQSNLLKAQNRVADMVANQNTTGYRAQKDIFAERVAKVEDSERVSFSKITGTTLDTRQGEMQVTNRQLDVAISGEGYFMVETPLGARYTRAGNFTVSPEGLLVTKDGYSVSGPGGGGVEFAEGDTDIIVRENGLITTGTGEERGQIGVFKFPNEQALQKVGTGYFKTDQSPELAEDSKIAQGMLESSNVNPVFALTDLITFSRGIENVKSLQRDIHSLKMGAIQKLGRNN